MNLAHLIDAGLERARQDVVDVGGDAQPADRQAHFLGDIARKDVAEIPGRHRESDVAMRRATAFLPPSSRSAALPDRSARWKASSALAPSRG